jgi:hypothetical protein
MGGGQAVGFGLGLVLGGVCAGKWSKLLIIAIPNLGFLDTYNGRESLTPQYHLRFSVSRK